MLKILVCDDNIVHADYTSKHISVIFTQKNFEFEIKQTHNASELLDYIYTIGAADFLFLDINLVTDSGITLAKKITEIYPEIKIIFVTGNIEYANDIFEARPVYFMTKPINLNKMEKAINKALEYTIVTPPKILVESFSKLISINQNSIQYIESVKRQIHIYHDDQITTCYKKLDEIELELTCNFLRCHQSFIVNMNHVKYLENMDFVLKNNSTVPISTRRASTVRDSFFDFIHSSHN